MVYSSLSQIQRLCRNTRAFTIFPLEREADLSRLVGYERYVYSEFCPKDPSGHGELSLVSEAVDKTMNSCWFCSRFASNYFPFLCLFQVRQRPSTCLSRQGTREVLLRVIWKR